MPVIRAVVSDENPVKQGFLLPEDIVSLLTAMISLPIISVFFWQRLQAAQTRGPSVASVTLLLIYISSFLFIFVLTAVVHIRTDQNEDLCDATIVLCLTLFILTRSASFLFLIERAYIISWPVNPRWKTVEYILSCLLIFVPYAVVSGLSINYRFAFTSENNVCIIGIQMYALLPLMLVEVLAYLYLTLRFLAPLLMVHFGGPGLLAPLKKVVIRTFSGTAIAMLSVLAVKISMTMFDGEPAWLCCTTCKIDALVSCCVFHWITRLDRSDEGEPGTPQVHGIGFDDNTTATATPQDSTSDRIASDPMSFPAKIAL